MKKILTLILCITSLVGSIQAQKKITADKKSSTVTYSMKHPLHDWDGINKAVNAVLIYDEATKTIKQVAVVLKVNDFDSENSNRDSHTVEVLESLKFPNVSFSSTSVIISGNAITAKGNLNFHGVTKATTLTGTIAQTDKKISFTGGFSVLMTDHGITKPTLMGVAADNEIKIKVVANFPL
ncbi:MAG: YceI family protein [Leadbetterella sp.]